MDRDQYLQQNNIFFEDKNRFEKPITSFENDPRLPNDIAQRLATLNFTNPTPIQAVSIPIILNKNDFVGISKTGSGKTLAFLIPGFKYLSEINTKSVGQYMPRMMIISPTRELSIQTFEVCQKFNLFDSACVYGGAARGIQYTAIKSRKPPIVVGTPGRINDFAETGLINLEKCKYLVLDEADKMFDMGFHSQIMKIIDQCPDNTERQTLLFSATWTEKVQNLANPMLNPNRAVVSIGPLYGLVACSDIKQHLFLVQEKDKKELLRSIIEEFEGYKILVFTNTKLKSQMMSNFVNDLGVVRSEYINGDVTQERRERIIKEFNTDKLMVIFATDLASRGLDIKDIHVVVNYDFPIDIESYVHRIGRSGRNGAKGLSFTFVTHKIFENSYNHRKLLKIVKDSGNKIPAELEI